MALIPNNVLSGITDRIGAQAHLVRNALNSGINTGSPFYKRVHTGISPDGDWGVETYLIDAAHNLDVYNASGLGFRNMYSTFIGQIESQVQSYGASSLDSFLFISGLNVGASFESVYFNCKTSHLNSCNVFFQHTDNILVGSYFPTGSGTGLFVAGTAVGTGTGNTSPTNYAAAKMVLVPVVPVTANIQINPRFVDEPTSLNGTTRTSSDNITVTNGTGSGIQFACNSFSPHLSVSNIVAAGGASGNGFNIYAIREREMVL
jgi:hypothetical protein